jgi:hypothetical protein
MDLTPRNGFNCKLANRYWTVPIDLPKATHLNTPIGTRYCDTLPYMCHPQQYKTQHGTYRDIQTESILSMNLDYYNPYDVPCNNTQKLSPELTNTFYPQKMDPCTATPQLWRNNSKLHKYNMAV